jgi:hypothetical protein
MPAPTFDGLFDELTLVAGQPVNFQVGLTPTSEPGTAWSFSGLPPGWSGDTGTGYITGTCSTTGAFTFTVTAEAYDASTASHRTLVHFTTSLGVPRVSAGDDVAGNIFTPISVTPTAIEGVAITWDWQSVPSGLTFNPANGALTGTVATPGTYTLTVSASNSYGVGPSDTLVIVIADSYTPSGLTNQLVNAFVELTTGVVSATKNGPALAGPIWSHKYGDDKIFNLTFTREGTVVELDLETLKLTQKVRETEPSTAEHGGTADDARWQQVGTTTTTAYRFYVDLEKPALLAELSNAEDDKGTFVDTLCEWEWAETNGYTPAIGPDPLVGSSLSFIYRVYRDLTVNA